MLSKKQISKFQTDVYTIYNSHKRAHLPWRKTHNPYHILVSEMMLQQTQVDRVVPKYIAFIKRFKSLHKLSEAKQSDVLTLWKGLGYNRRALYLKKCAEEITHIHKGIFPKDIPSLIKLKGIGQSTAGAILNFAFNIPTPFIETNIRAIYIHHFFKNSSHVSDIQILSLVEQTIDAKNPREWFYALYDYGTMLKSSLGKKKQELHRKSKSYNKQSRFEGSLRQIRGQILKTLLDMQTGTIKEMQERSVTLKEADALLISKALEDLKKEGFISQKKKGSKFAIL